MADENKDTKPAEPITVAPEQDVPAVFDPDLVEDSEDDGTSRAEGLDKDDVPEEK